VCGPGVSVERVTLAVDGEPATTDPTPAPTPSRVKVTLPVGCIVPAVEGVMVALTTRGIPATGVVVAGETTVEVGVLDTTIFTDGEVEPWKFESPP
jgi:hypothetical protein